MVLMRSAWVLAMLAVTVLALMPIEHLQLPVFDGWDKAQHALALWVLTGWAFLLCRLGGQKYQELCDRKIVSC